MHNRYPKPGATREEFLSGWRDSFHKQFDTYCGWGFKNKRKLYGSVQLESVWAVSHLGMAAQEKRYELFNNTVE